jgi:transketolase
MLVIRPADTAETTVAWKLAIENTSSPTALILSHQNIDDLPSGNSRYTDALKSSMGAYTVSECEGKPDIILLASGSEVSTLLGGARLLSQKDKLRVRVVSVPSEGLFREQSEQYRESVLPHDVKKFGLTAGLPVTLKGLVGDRGMVIGLDHFGYSAPYKVLDQKFGFTYENVYHQVREYLGLYKR